MKVLSKLMCVGMFAVLVAGCASDGPYVPALPTHAQTQYLDYQSRPANKVFMVAIDPNGDFAVGYDYGKANKKEAYESALAKCNANRKTYGVLSQALVYDINGTVVYENAIKKSMSE